MFSLYKLTWSISYIPKEEDNIVSINSNSISNKYDYNLKELQNFMQAVYIGLSHYCYISFGSNNYSELVDTNDTLLSWYYVKYKDTILLDNDVAIFVF